MKKLYIMSFRKSAKGNEVDTRLPNVEKSKNQGSI